MRIAIYSHEFAPSVGGIETFVMGLAEGLSRRGHQVTVATRRPAGGFDDSALSFRVERGRSLARVARVFAKSDVVHLAGPVFAPILIAALLGRPLVVEHHGFQAICPNGQLYIPPDDAPCPGHFMAARYGECLRCNRDQGRSRSLRMLLATFPRRWLARLADRTIAPTAALSRVLQLPRTIVIHHAIDADLAKWPPPEIGREPVIAFMGRLVSTKGVRVLVDAAGLLLASGLRFRLKVIGDGPERARLETQSRRLGLQDHVQFCGRVSAHDLRSALRDVAVVVMPSLGGEVFGLIAGEAMMRGRAIVVSDLEPLREVVGDAGTVVPVGDARALAGALAPLLRSPEKAREQGRVAQKRALQIFREGRMLTEHERIFSRVCGTSATEQGAIDVADVASTASREQ